MAIIHAVVHRCRLCIIIDIYTGSSTHPKVVFMEVLYSIELELNSIELLIFEERGKPENLEENLSEQSKESTTNLTHSWPEPGPHRWETSVITTMPSLLRIMWPTCMALVFWVIYDPSVFSKANSIIKLQ